VDIEVVEYTSTASSRRIAERGLKSTPLRVCWLNSCAHCFLDFVAYCCHPVPCVVDVRLFDEEN